ncbi:ATP-dependent nuclease [Bacillus coahuilensis]|uniref:ATP-dependent nuclease n=1 Tax=Bacillus coahuilensis TaxID=408580 RepID=UPI0001850E55|nr:AAA family ATPase [Bacillus coahuilensis]
MGIRIKELRIRNFRSYKSADIDLSDNCVLIGANNVGKTTLLQAIQVAFVRGTRVGSDDIYINNGESLPKDRKAIIDLLIVPTDEQNNEVMEFEDKWFEHFGDLRSENPTDLGQFFAMRTVIAFDIVKGEYQVEKKALIEWPKTEEVESYSKYNRNRITDRVLQSIPIFYMDAKRDIASEMKDRYSYWGKLVKDVGLDEGEIEKIEGVLDEINDTIIERSSVLNHLTKYLSKISKTVNTKEESIKINPVSRKIRDLNRGIDITFKDQDSESFPISNHGMGTRSWITFLTLVAYIAWKNKQMKDEEIPYHPLILLEEPEAHLHPQAQRKIFNQINGIAGQKIVSTHSPMIVGQVDIDDIRHISKEEGMSKINYVDTTELDYEEIRKIRQEIFKTRGDLLFANAIILCEGETEEQALPVFFKEYFECETFEAGINVISVGGKGKYKPFLRIAKDFNINFYLLSDGEKETIKKVQKGYKKDIW